jgi:hypothetical protein
MISFQEKEGLPPPGLRLLPVVRGGGGGSKRLQEEHLTRLPEDLYQGGTWGLTAKIKELLSRK